MTYEQNFAKRRWWGDPLWHFLAMGAVLYVTDYWRSRDAAPGAANTKTSAGDEVSRIVLPQELVASLVVPIRQREGRDATPEERQAALDGYIRGEILYREARRLGLDRGDLIVRRRLVQKMEFLTEQLARNEAPTDADMEAWLAGHEERYRRPDRVSFEHVFFSRDRRGERAQADARAALAGISEGVGFADVSSLGDAFMLRRQYMLQSERDIRGSFGGDFATALMAQQAGSWQGPVTSSYGVHLVRVTERSPGGPSALAEVSQRVRIDLVQQLRKDAINKVVAELRARYEIVIDDGRELGARTAQVSR